MLEKIPAENIFFANYGWHTGRFHFSFEDYDDPENTHFGVLKALNEFVLRPGSGFETHPHQEMEIISFCVQGELTHGDSLGNTNTLHGGDVQYLSAGSGITHSELNEIKDSYLRFYQIWIAPNEDGLQPKYDCQRFSRLSSPNKLRLVASGTKREGVIHIAQDANIYTGRLFKLEKMAYTNWAGRQSYLTCLVGAMTVNETALTKHDALKILGEENLTITSQEDCLFLLVEMAAER
jgi:redox-sensitive bicupin YhaK (pirin superfamily)